MLIYDPKGNERGGYVTSDGGDLAAFLTLDSESDQVFTAYANGGSGATVWVANEKHQNVVMSTHNTAVLEIIHGKKVVYKQPPDAAALKQWSRLIGMGAVLIRNGDNSFSSPMPVLRANPSLTEVRRGRAESGKF